MNMTVGELIELLKDIPEDVCVSSIQLMDNERLTYMSLKGFEVNYDKSAQQIHFLGELTDIM